MSECDEPTRNTTYGGASIGYDQEQGGTNFPFLGTTGDPDLRTVIGDLWLGFVQTACFPRYPLRIRWLYGFGCLAATVPGDLSPQNEYEILIEDQDGVVVLDSRTAALVVDDWGDYLKVLSWTTLRGSLTVAKYTKTNTFTPGELPTYFEPDEAKLDPACCEPIGAGLTSVTVGSVVATDVVRFTPGYNTTISVGDTTFVEGQASTEVEIGFEALSGLGQFPADCDGVEPFIATINGVAPVNGRITLVPVGGCFRFGLPITSDATAETDDAPRRVRVAANTLTLSDDCKPCSTCDDYIAVYEGARRLTDRYREVQTLVYDARDSLIRSIERFNEQKLCRERNFLQVGASVFCPCTVRYVVAYCNQTDECLKNVILHFSFEHVLGGTPISTGEIVPNTVFAGGYNSPQLRRSVGDSTYRVYGAFPHYWAYLPQIDPRQQAYVSFFVAFDACETTDEVIMVAEAFSVDEYVPNNVVSPVPGYTLGIGWTDIGGAIELAAPIVNSVTDLLPVCEAF